MIARDRIGNVATNLLQLAPSPWLQGRSTRLARPISMVRLLPKKPPVSPLFVANCWHSQTQNFWANETDNMIECLGDPCPHNLICQVPASLQRKASKSAITIKLCALNRVHMLESSMKYRLRDLHLNLHWIFVHPLKPFTCTQIGACKFIAETPR